jgi:hypothetical protein
MSDASTPVLVLVVTVMLVVFAMAAGVLLVRDRVRGPRIQGVPYVPSACSFCGTPREHADKLIAGPGVAICEKCARDSMAEGAKSLKSRAESASGTLPSLCSFCNRPLAGVSFSRSGCTICGECSGICAQILEDHAPEASVGEGAAQQ